MYYPYFRGKQYELMTIRENATLLAESEFVPIIEPVKESTNGLKRAITELMNANGECILIINPCCGDHCQDNKLIKELLEKEEYTNASGLSVGLLLTSSMDMSEVESICDSYSSRKITLIHYGFDGGKDLADAITSRANINRHIFVDEFCSKLYRRHFVGDDRIRILLKDGFQRRINRDHPESEPFSDLYLTYKEENMDGFGDFLVVGDDYSESGGPAYAVAIHLTYINEKKDGEMYIYHFVSDRSETYTDHAGKYEEALKKLVAEANKPNSQIYKSKAVMEFINDSHYHGLGYIKKLSMQHHIETLAHYLKKKS